MLCAECGEKPAQEGRTTCFRCRVSGVGFAFRGGAIVGRKGWNVTKGDFLREHIGSDSEKQLAKRTDVERV